MLNGSARKRDKKYSLPTEAQWQYAAGTSQEDICPYANVMDCSNDYDYTAPVGSFKPNKFGLFDMSGNVSEWTCSDENNSKTCVGEKPNNPVIILGDSWDTQQNRMAYPYELGDDYIGFRVVRY
jgi:formylglycine-generating enzyme required for sulfatase activity